MALYDDRDQVYLKSLEQERISLTGQDCIFYSLIRGANVDPLYGETLPDSNTGSIGLVYREMFLVIGVIIFEQKDNRDPSVRSEGLIVDYDATMHIAINEWNEKRPSDFEPKEGDVVTGMGYYFDIIKV